MGFRYYVRLRPYRSFSNLLRTFSPNTCADFNDYGRYGVPSLKESVLLRVSVLVWMSVIASGHKTRPRL